jgi:hypothetical protein
MTVKQFTAKKYVVKLSEEERERLNPLIRAGTRPARLCPPGPSKTQTASCIRGRPIPARDGRF